MIVFDGYPQEPSTKDTTHLRRKSTKAGTFVSITPHMKLNMKKDLFLSVLRNKSLFKKMLKDHINNSNSGIQAIQDDADADYLLAKTAITKSMNNDVVVISADTDVLILLIHGMEDSTYKICLTSELVTATRSVPKVWDIDVVKSTLGPNVSHNILAIHAFFGCDTVSRIYGFGKGTGLKKFISNEQFRSYLSLFSNKNMSQGDIASAGEKAIAMLYGGNSSETLDKLRYTVFCTKLSVNTKFVSPELLPPTTDAATFHSYRAYHQVQTWMGVNLPPEEWG